MPQPLSRRIFLALTGAALAAPSLSWAADDAEEEEAPALLDHIILEQQVSLASAKAAFDRLNSAVRPLTPRRFLKLTDAELLRIGFSRQKTLYTRLLAESLSRRHFDLRYLHELHDDAARKMLIAFKGIGNWTADIYLLSALRRPDIWPVGDLALATAVQEVKQLRKRPSAWKNSASPGVRTAPSPPSFSGIII